MTTTCPICLGNYFLTEFSAEVCNRHQNWFVTVCSHCGRSCFSDVVGECVGCGNAADKIGEFTRSAAHGTPDRRSPLRKYGLEWFK